MLSVPSQVWTWFYQEPDRRKPSGSRSEFKRSRTAGAACLCAKEVSDEFVTWDEWLNQENGKICCNSQSMRGWFQITSHWLIDHSRDNLLTYDSMTHWLPLFQVQMHETFVRWPCKSMCPACSACERSTQLPSIIAVTRGPSTSYHSSRSRLESETSIHSSAQALSHSKQPAEFFRTLQSWQADPHLLCGCPSLAMSSCTWRCFNSSWRQWEYLTKQQAPLFDDVLPER